LSYLINIHEQNTQRDWCKAHHVTTDTLRCHVVATPILPQIDMLPRKGATVVSSQVMSRSSGGEFLKLVTSCSDVGDTCRCYRTVNTSLSMLSAITNTAYL